MPIDARVQRFRRLHESGCFVMPNPWDVGSARLLAGLGFEALATTSSGFAWSTGRPDNHVSLADALGHMRTIAASVDVPVNADFEAGFAIDPEGVAVNVAEAARTGIAGLSIEDSTGDPRSPLFDAGLSVERIRAARRALDASGTGVVLTARSEGFIVGRPDLAETIRRLEAYAEAGADCLYAPGLRSIADIGAVVGAVAPKPVNVLVSSDFTTVAALAELGVRRISVGGALARAAWRGFAAAAKEIAERGTFTSLASREPALDLELLAGDRDPPRGRVGRAGGRARPFGGRVDREGVSREVAGRAARRHVFKVAQDSLGVKRGEQVDFVDMRVDRPVAHPHRKVAVLTLDVGIVFPLAKDMEPAGSAGA